MREMIGQRDFELFYDYALIAYENYYNYNLTTLQLNKLIGKAPINYTGYDERLEEYRQICKNGSKYRIVTLVFSSLSIEAYLYTLGVELLGKESMKRIEKNPIIFKWRKIFFDGFGYRLENNIEFYSLLKKMIYTRNMFTHAKSEDHFCPENQIEADENWKKYIELESSFITPEEICKLLEMLRDLITNLKIGKSATIPVLAIFTDFKNQDV